MKRNTPQRRTILKTLALQKNHPSASQLYEHIHKTHSHISKATVFRVLKHEAEDNSVMRISCGDFEARYESAAPAHYHMRCTECGSVFDSPVSYINSLNNPECGVSDFVITGHNLEFFGICGKCGTKCSAQENNQTKDL